MSDGYIALIGLGAIGIPLSHLLYQKYRDNFILLADEPHAERLRKQNIIINETLFSPKIITNNDLLDKQIKVLFVCVKNYNLDTIFPCLYQLLSEETIILPLQNGLYASECLKSWFPSNIILEGFAQGPNTRGDKGVFIYQNPGVYHVGTSNKKYLPYVELLHSILTSSGIQCVYEERINHAVWKKLMLNVAGNALTALTGINYLQMKKSLEAQNICKQVMQEFKNVAITAGVEITEEDIEDVFQYFLNYTQPKHTSMLEDVLHNRRTENEYIAGFVKKLADKNNISIPHINMLYFLMKVKEQVYLNEI